MRVKKGRCWDNNKEKSRRSLSRSRRPGSKGALTNRKREMSGFRRRPTKQTARHLGAKKKGEGEGTHVNRGDPRGKTTERNYFRGSRREVGGTKRKNGKRGGRGGVTTKRQQLDPVRTTKKEKTKPR